MSGSSKAILIVRLGHSKKKKDRKRRGTSLPQGRQTGLGADRLSNDGKELKFYK